MWENSVLAEPPVVAYIGALTPNKIGSLLEGFEHAQASGRQMQLVVAGDGPLAAAIVARAESNSQVSYLGSVDDDGRDRLLRQATLLVIPSQGTETSPLVFFEALAAGLPVIGSDIAGMTELARFGNLVLVPAGKADELGDALVAVLTNTAELARLRAEAQRHRDVASPQRFVDDVNRVIETLIESPAASVGKRGEGTASARDETGEQAPAARMLGDHEE